MTATERTALQLVEGEPRSFRLTLTDLDGTTPIDVTAIPLALHVHERDDDDEVFAPLAVTALVPNVVGQGRVIFAAEDVALLATDKQYVGRLRKESGESLDVVDIELLRAWR